MPTYHHMPPGFDPTTNENTAIPQRKLGPFLTIAAVVMGLCSLSSGAIGWYMSANAAPPTPTLSPTETATLTPEVTASRTPEVSATFTQTVTATSTTTATATIHRRELVTPATATSTMDTEALWGATMTVIKLTDIPYQTEMARTREAQARLAVPTQTPYVIYQQGDTRTIVITAPPPPAAPTQAPQIVIKPVQVVVTAPPIVVTATFTHTPTATATMTHTPTATATLTETPTATATLTETPTATVDIPTATLDIPTVTVEMPTLEPTLEVTP